MASLSSVRARPLHWAGAVTALALLLPLPLQAQYFGRNKVQYETFDFHVLKTPHFDIHYYPEMAEAIEDAARMAERWYERLARTFQHEFERSKPVIFYADHPDFQQTNTLQGFIGEGTGGVTESLKNRVIMPLTGSYADTDHVLGHELVHAFQYNLAQSRTGGGIQGLARLPLWLVEGMAEYLSVGREDPLTAMWLRDAVRRDDLPTISQMTREGRFFPYRFGQALWAYIGGTYGDDAVVQLFRRALRVGWDPALQQVLAVGSDTLSENWKQAVHAEYLPLMEGRMAPPEAGQLLLGPSTGAGRQNVAPSVSPDGRHVAFLSEKDLFSVDLFLADARTGEILRKLSSAASDPHFDALRYIDSSGSWSPDGRQFVFVVFANGDNELVIVDVDSGATLRQIPVDEVGAITTPAWSPDGRYIAFAGSAGGMSDIYTLDLETDEVRRLTNDKHADFQPTWSPDGRTLAFVSDRGPETDFERLTYSRMQLATVDVASGAVRVIPVFGNVKHINPQYSPDGEGLYFVSDQDGFSDIYRLELRSGEVRRITRLATAVSGITYMSPAVSVASQSGQLVFSVFDSFEFHIYSLDSQGAVAAARRIDAAEQPAPGRLLPPVELERPTRVAAYLADPATGLVAPGTYSAADADDYRSRLSLDFVGQPTIGVGTDQFGNYIGGGASAFFSDMLGNRLLGVAVQAQGTFKDIGGQAFYQNQERRWNWGVAGGRIPYLLVRQSLAFAPGGQRVVYRDLERIFVTSARGVTAYPFSTTRRFEATAGATRYSFDVEREEFIFDSFGNLIARRRENVPDAERRPLNLAHGSVALVGDNSFFGFTSPVRGGRWRVEVEQTLGTLDYTTLITDYRRYYNPSRLLTVGMRGLHYGRYGHDVETGRDLRRIFLGFETFVRGYSFESFSTSECTPLDPQAAAESTCAEFDRLFGHRIGVANFELRVPLFGTERFGLINFPYFPTELVAFADAGMAWDRDNRVDLRWTRDPTTARVPVASAGGSARVNILGFLVLEAYYAYPFQRPAKGWHWGFQIAPGW